jgi:hypothetical protein
MNLLKNRFTGALIIGSLTLSISSYIYNFFYKKEDNKLIKEPENKINDNYENKYYEKYEALDNIKLSKDELISLKNNIVLENSPRGTIIMYYDNDTEVFDYYADSKDIPYLYLEAVARKYAISFNCKCIVVDIKKELEEAKKEKIIVKSTITPKNEGTFANFKNYNRKGTGGAKTINNKSIIRENANRYKYKGKIIDYSGFKKNNSTKKQGQKIDYNTFKKLNMQKK